MAGGAAGPHARCMSTYESSDARLVCGVDHSEHAVDVVAFASQLADRLGLRLRVVHSVHPSTYIVGEKRDEMLAGGAAFLAGLVPNVPEQERVVQLGHPVDLVQSALTGNGVMAVVGSRGLGAARTALLGSVSRSLAGSAPCPVVIVPPQASVRLGITPGIICGVDGSEASDCALEHAAALAYALGGRLMAVNVSTEPGYLAVAASWGARAFLPVDYARAGDDALAAGRAALTTVEGAAARLRIGMPVSVRIERGDPAVRLRAVAAEFASPILVVGSHGHTGLLEGLGSVSSHLAANAPAPVMVVPPGLTTSPGRWPHSGQSAQPEPSAANTAAGWEPVLGS
jgi:nucleotide-binding universal stress UspA family protein